MTTTLARLVAPHVLTPEAITHIAGGGAPAELPHVLRVPCGACLHYVTYRCDTPGVTVTSSVDGPGRVRWAVLADIVTAGLTPTDGTLIERAHDRHMTALIARNTFLDANPGWHRDQDPVVMAEIDRLTAAVTVAYDERARAVGVVVDAGVDRLIDDGQLELDLATYIDRKAREASS